jgi:tRNA (adenine57-N1/adenine58-N1)-methyltransferase catalytic subunit
LLRQWQVKGLSVRPTHRMVAHSAFIIVARRLAG